jgi:hypothetical protein
MKLVRLMKMCLNDTYSRVWVGKHLSDRLPVKKGLKADALSPLLFGFALEYAIRRVQANHEGMKLNCTHKLAVYADDVTTLDRSTHTIKKNTEVLVVASKEIGLEVNAEKTKCVRMLQLQNAGQNHNIQINNKSFGRVEQVKYLGPTQTNLNFNHEEIKSRLKSANASYHSVPDLLSSSLLSKNIKIKIYRTIILPVVSYGCETWSLTLREEHKLKVFENRVLKWIFGPKIDEVTFVSCGRVPTDALRTFLTRSPTTTGLLTCLYSKNLSYKDEIHLHGISISKIT